jgi:hypothetical protein
MKPTLQSRRRLGITALVLAAVLAHLAWEHFDGGIARHHLLARSDLPAVSNAWGALLLPALTWFLVGRTQRRLALQPPGSRSGVGAAAGFAAALAYGLLLSWSYTHGLEALSSALFLGAFALAVLLRIYRAECVLGFVLAMSYTFGGVLPILIATVIASVSALVHLGGRPLLARLWRRMRGGGPAAA